MTAYVIYQDNNEGDLVDVEFYDRHECMIAALENSSLFTRNEEGGRQRISAGNRVGSITFGKVEEGLDKVEYPVFCGWCNTGMNEEAQR